MGQILQPTASCNARQQQQFVPLQSLYETWFLSEVTPIALYAVSSVGSYFC